MNAILRVYQGYSMAIVKAIVKDILKLYLELD